MPYPSSSPPAPRLCSQPLINNPKNHSTTKIDPVGKFVRVART